MGKIANASASSAALTARIFHKIQKLSPLNDSGRGVTPKFRLYESEQDGAHSETESEFHQSDTEDEVKSTAVAQTRSRKKYINSVQP